MKTDNKSRIYRFLQDQLAQTEFRVRAYVFDEKGEKNPNRNAFFAFKDYLFNFLEGDSDARWFMIAGLRGAGKTTLLAQLYYEINYRNVKKLYLSVDQIVQILGVSLQDVLEVYQELIGSSFEQLQDPLLLFLDEIQYDEKWAILLKTIYDRSKKIGIIATGSAALTLQTNPDVARRAIFEKLFPMTFAEYAKIKFNKSEIHQLSSTLREIMYQSKSAKQIFQQMQPLEREMRSYWMGLEEAEKERYMRYGTLPFMVTLNNEALVYDQIKKTLDRVISSDLSQNGNFDQSVISKVPVILYALSDTDVLSINKLSTMLEISRPTLMTVFDLLEKTEILFRLYPYGNHYTQIRKPSKYLFTSPAFRSMYFNFIGSTLPKEVYTGKLLEDTVGLYLNKYVSRRPNSSITYDNREGGADFIVRLGKKQIIFEVGSGRKKMEQIEHTMSRVTDAYGICISSNSLQLHEDKNIISIPTDYFLLS